MASTHFYISDPIHTSKETKESILFYLTKILKLLSLSSNNEGYKETESLDIMPFCELLNSLCIGLEAVFFHGLNKTSMSFDIDASLMKTHNGSFISQNNSISMEDQERKNHANICDIQFWTLAKHMVLLNEDAHLSNHGKDFCETLNNELFNFAIITNNYKILEHIAKFSAFMNVNEKISMFEDILSPHTLGKAWIRYCVNKGILLKNFLLLYVTFLLNKNEVINRSDKISLMQNEANDNNLCIRNLIDTCIDLKDVNKVYNLKGLLNHLYLPHAYIRDVSLMTQLIKLIINLPLFQITNTSKRTSLTSFPKTDVLSPIIYYPAKAFAKEHNAMQCKLSTASLIVAGYRPYYEEITKLTTDTRDIDTNENQPLPNLVNSLKCDKSYVMKDVFHNTSHKYCYDQTLDEYIPIGEELDENNIISSPDTNSHLNCDIFGVQDLTTTNGGQTKEDKRFAVRAKPSSQLQSKYGRIKNPVIAEILENKFSKTSVNTSTLDELTRRWEKYLPLPNSPDNYSTSQSLVSSSGTPNPPPVSEETMIKGERDELTNEHIMAKNEERRSSVKACWSSPSMLQQPQIQSPEPCFIAATTSQDDEIVEVGREEFEKLKVSEASSVDELPSSPKADMPLLHPGGYQSLIPLYYRIMLSNHPNILERDYVTQRELEKFLCLHDAMQNEKGLDLQNNACAGRHCSRFIGFGTEYRVCHYDGLYYCTYCHLNESSIIPARLLLNWDFKLYKVCHRDKVLLDTCRNDPLMRLRNGECPLYNNITGLDSIRIMKSALYTLYNLYLSSCSLRVVQKFLKNRRGNGDFVTAILTYLNQPRCGEEKGEVLPEELYSVGDLVKRPNSYIQSLKESLQSIESHVHCCPNCSSKRLLCQECHVLTSHTLPSICSPSSPSNLLSPWLQNVMNPICRRCFSKKHNESSSNFFIDAT